MRKFGLMIVAFLATVFCVGALAADGAATQTTYRCYKSGDGPPRCLVLYADGTTATVEQAAETLDWPSFLAAMRTLKTGQPTPILRDHSGPITECGNGHGQTACCRIVAEYENMQAVDIDCGR